MVNPTTFLKSKWRKAHLDKNNIKIGKNLRLNKRTLRFYKVSNATPNLIIVGSQKCGTTSLHNYLNEHPDIFMSSPFKEPGFFIFEKWAKDFWKENGIIIKSKQELKTKYMIDDSYVNQKYFGESSTHYTINDRVRRFDIVNNIYKVSPNAKILYIIRNPFERVISSYYHWNKYLNYKKTVDQYVFEESSAIETTKYLTQIKPFCDRFESNVLLLLFEDLIQDPKTVLNNIYNFLDVSKHNHDDFKIFNKTSPNTKTKLSLESYELLKPIFIEEKKQLEYYFGIEINWDMSIDTWAK